MIKHSVYPPEREKALSLILSAAIPFNDNKEIEDFYQYLILKAISECPPEILKILLHGLRNSMETVQSLDSETVRCLGVPLAHNCWKRHDFVHLAARRGDVNTVRLVLAYGGDAASVGAWDHTALHKLSFFSDNRECAEILLSSGAMKVLGHRLPKTGMTAFANAVANCNFLVADYLLEYTSPNERKTMLSSRPAEGMSLVNQGISFFGHLVAWSAVLGEKPLEYIFRQREAVEDKQSFFIVEETHKLSAIILACGLWSHGMIYDPELFTALRRRKAISCLLRNFNEPHYLDWADSQGNTALHHSAFLGNTDAASALLNSGASPNRININGATPLDLTFLADPKYIADERGPGKRIVEIFEENRNEICKELRSKGAIHALPVATQDAWATHLPFPWLHDMRARLIYLPFPWIPDMRARLIRSQRQPQQQQQQEESLD